MMVTPGQGLKPGVGELRDSGTLERRQLVAVVRQRHLVTMCQNFFSPSSQNKLGRFSWQKLQAWSHTSLSSLV
jgi:hypothetical protein